MIPRLRHLPPAIIKKVETAAHVESARVQARRAAIAPTGWTSAVSDVSAPGQLTTSGMPAAPAFGADSQEWLRLCVRNPSEPVLDAGYLRRAHASITDVFGPWLRGEASQPGFTFREMLREQHRVLVAGREGAESYAGASRREHNLATNYRVAPGVFVDEVIEPSTRISFSLHRPSLLEGNESPLIQDLAAQYPEAEVVGREFIGPNSDALHSPVAHAYRTRLPRVDAASSPYNEVVGDYITHHYSRVSDLQATLEAMAEVMGELRSLPAAGAVRTDQLLRLLSEYVYLGAHGHMFTGANFSLVMSQLNHILQGWGLRGISHGNLDYVALTHSFDEFLTRFCLEIARANPFRISSRDLPHAFPVAWRPVPFETLVHFAEEGDVPLSGALISSGGRTRPIEAVKIAPDALPAGVALEVRARLEGLGDSDWMAAGELVGTRGEARPLTGLGVRLVGPDADLYDVQLQTRVADGLFSEPSASGDFKPGTEPLTGLKLSVHRSSDGSAVSIRDEGRE